jgi:hypothetical protein
MFCFQYVWYIYVQRVANIYTDNDLKMTINCNKLADGSVETIGSVNVQALVP